MWLSEGFATYFTLLFTEHDGGRDAFVAGLERSRGGIRILEQRLPDTPVIHRNLADMNRVLNQLVYQKGGWTLHMLRGEIGTETFWTGIREYYRRYRDANASTAEFRTVMEQASGKSLDWFFAQWLTRPGIPRIEGSWRYDAAARQVEVTVTQTQTADPYRLTVDVGIQPDGRRAAAYRASGADGAIDDRSLPRGSRRRGCVARPEHLAADGRRPLHTSAMMTFRAFELSGYRTTVQPSHFASERRSRFALANSESQISRKLKTDYCRVVVRLRLFAREPRLAGVAVAGSSSSWFSLSSGCAASPAS